jgi:cytochrome c-type biogenesis protein CcmH
VASYARWVRLALIVNCLLLAPVLLAESWPAAAVEPKEMLADPVLEARAREISRGLRCVVCQNESIDESDADLAHDLRVLVRERLKAGDSDEQVVQFVVDRYGDFVLLRPPVKPETYLLWASPAILLLVAGVIIAMYLRRHRGGIAMAQPLTAEEQARVEALLKAELEP